ncbi:MAG TPA: N-methyl-L-tryptophan oxidase [Blastocatellia bacterium]|nr:N-methyl-L-tryptophan oxidase [Blastocatellia bacterium]
MQTFDVAIVGAGVMGAAAACELAREGARVAMADQSPIPNPRAASVDHSKVFRFAYPNPFYVKLAVDSLNRWRTIESETGTRLLTQTGALLIGKREPSFETECYEAMRSLGLESEKLDSREASARFPQFNSSAFAYGVYDPSGAILHAETAVRALIDLARQRGVEIIEGERVIEAGRAGSRVLIVTESGHEIECERAMIASGPWTRKLLPFLEDKLTTTRQEIVYFEPGPEQSHSSPLSFEPNRFPIFLELESGFYGFPIHHAGAMKIANHHKGAEVDPDSAEDHVGEQFIERCRAFFAEFIPGLADARVREARVCIYNNTPDDDFIIDWHPQLDGVLVVTGFSGHGFKFGPTIGRIASELLMTGKTSFEIGRFELARLRDPLVI